jgi:hypothetical protein
VRLTRANEEVPTPEDIARTTNRFLADRYIEIRHRPEPPESLLVIRTYHFPGSRTGRRMAEDVGTAMSMTMDYPAREPQSQVTYPLQQTACPAMIVEAPSIASVDEEMRLDQSYYLRLQAYAVFTGVLNHFAAPDSASLIVRINHQIAAGWLVTIDDTWTLLSGPTGDVRFTHLPYGEHRVSARRNDLQVSTTVRIDLEATTLSLTP